MDRINKGFILFLAVFVLFYSNTAFSLPIDWHGVFGVDLNKVENFRKIEEKAARTAGTLGSQEVGLAAGEQANSNWSSYIFRLNPVVIINDSTTVKSEWTTGYGRGGRLGDSSMKANSNRFGNALYGLNTSDVAQNSINLNKLYMELYSDTATYIIGRHSMDWGLGAVFNSGENVWDRYSYIHDGIIMEIKLDSFKIAPYWARISSENSLTSVTSAKEYGIKLLYDSIERDLSFGILYGIKKNEVSNQAITADVDGLTAPGDLVPETPLGATSIKLFDLFLKKTIGKFSFAVEAPIYNGTMGQVYDPNTSTKYKAQAVILESSYRHDDNLTLGIFAGKVNGDNGGEGSFDAMYLNPNYQVANLMFRYNMAAVSDPSNTSLYDSYITNAKYLKFYANYKMDRITWKGAFIYGVADEAAKIGSAFNHTTNTQFVAVTDQKSDLGYEVDIDCDYQWNKEVNFGASIGYHFVGEYYAYTNDAAQVNHASDSYILQVRSSIDF